MSKDFFSSLLALSILAFFFFCDLVSHAQTTRNS
jgi:hypothetical protein